MNCEGCGNSSAHRISVKSNGMTCDKCGGASNFRFSDVYFKERYFDEHIAHPDKFPNGVEIRSREHKAHLMRELNLKEKGDRRHGAR